MSESEVVFNANSAIVQLYNGENKLISNEIMMSSELDLYSGRSLKQQSTGRHVAVRILKLYLYKNASREVSVTLFLKTSTLTVFSLLYYLVISIVYINTIIV